MTDVNFVELLAKIGVKAELAEPAPDNQLFVSLTIGQYGKLTEALPDTKLGTVKGSRIIALVSVDSLTAAVENNVKAPRGAVNVKITSRTLYNVEAPEAANEITQAWWDSDSAEGAVTVNGFELAINEGVARDFYEVAEDEKGDRPVYFVTFTDGDGEEITLSAYGVSNLLKRLCAVRVAIQG